MPALEQTDMLGLAFDVVGTPFEILFVTEAATSAERKNARVTPEQGDHKNAQGFRARRKSTRSDRGHDRRTWLTRPSGTPEGALEALRKEGLLASWPTEDATQVLRDYGLLGKDAQDL